MKFSIASLWSVAWIGLKSPRTLVFVYYGFILATLLWVASFSVFGIISGESVSNVAPFIYRSEPERTAWDALKYILFQFFVITSVTLFLGYYFGVMKVDRFRESFGFEPPLRRADVAGLQRAVNLKLVAVARPIRDNLFAEENRLQGEFRRWPSETMKAIAIQDQVAQVRATIKTEKRKFWELHALAGAFGFTRYLSLQWYAMYR